ncbi:dienelactone hydrolase family protein [Agromyces albus]|uniref:dienelactone hydrolase family protein n=1 Tax=Agromyces albus TaxID=205332 RepID=UPI0027826AD1|nr:alpha/beta fold hydrolase [Agromyces albus]MDQ0576728.1 putative phosphoribosyl transferase [Agromyces albus]
MARNDSTGAKARIPVRIPHRDIELDGDLTVPAHPRGLVVFAHGSGSGRHSPRNQHVAADLASAGFATLLMDLLTQAEEDVDVDTREHRFDIPLLAARVVSAIDWAEGVPEVAELPVIAFGASTGAAAALVAAAKRPDRVAGVVSRGGRPDLAGDALADVRAPVLLIVGGNDLVVIQLNEDAARELTAPVDIRIVPGATHLFEEPGTLDRVTDLVLEALDRWLPTPTGRHR